MTQTWADEFARGERSIANGGTYFEVETQVLMPRKPCQSLLIRPIRFMMMCTREFMKRLVFGNRTRRFCGEDDDDDESDESD